MKKMRRIWIFHNRQVTSNYLKLVIGKKPLSVELYIWVYFSDFVMYFGLSAVHALPFGLAEERSVHYFLDYFISSFLPSGSNGLS